MTTLLSTLFHYNVGEKCLWNLMLLYADQPVQPVTLLIVSLKAAEPVDGIK